MDIVNLRGEDYPKTDVTCHRLYLFFLNEIDLYIGSGELGRKQLLYS